MKRLFANEYYQNCCNQTSVSVKKITAINGYRSFICRENTPETLCNKTLYPYGQYVVAPVDLKNICEDPLQSDVKVFLEQPPNCCGTVSPLFIN